MSIYYGNIKVSGGGGGSIQPASKDVLGGFYTGFKQTGDNYPIELSSDNKGYVNVPFKSEISKLENRVSTLSSQMSSFQDGKYAVLSSANTFTEQNTFHNLTVQNLHTQGEQKTADENLSLIVNVEDGTTKSITLSDMHGNENYYGMIKYLVCDDLPETTKEDVFYFIREK